MIKIEELLLPALMFINFIAILVVFIFVRKTISKLQSIETIQNNLKSDLDIISETLKSIEADYDGLKKDVASLSGVVERRFDIYDANLSNTINSLNLTRKEDLSKLFFEFQKVLKQLTESLRNINIEHRKEINSYLENISKNLSSYIESLKNINIEHRKQINSYLENISKNLSSYIESLKLVLEEQNNQWLEAVKNLNNLLLNIEAQIDSLKSATSDVENSLSQIYETKLSEFNVHISEYVSNLEVAANSLKEMIAKHETVTESRLKDLKEEIENLMDENQFLAEKIEDLKTFLEKPINIEEYISGGSK